MAQAYREPSLTVLGRCPYFRAVVKLQKLDCDKDQDNRERAETTQTEPPRLCHGGPSSHTHPPHLRGLRKFQLEGSLKGHESNYKLLPGAG